MSLKHHHHHLKEKDKDNKSVAKITTCTISPNDSFEQEQGYQEQFTLMVKPNKSIVKNRQSCLAMKIALTFPPKIKEEVVKMVQYYESTLEKQTADFHRLVQENAKLKKQNEKLSAQNMIHDLEQEMRTPVKQNHPHIFPRAAFKASHPEKQEPVSQNKNNLKGETQKKHEPAPQTRNNWRVDVQNRYESVIQTKNPGRGEVQKKAVSPMKILKDWNYETVGKNVGQKKHRKRFQNANID